ncbi:hypothetical protein [Actinacidiphila yeochonensis]|uniref:hypothetical protein n=1 Tax=Actinacidiphila yeochonensis TaxID=89050 RepID=UPI00055B73F3|nr:hypothetical protein [Actinacidiphila yeochonensis]
MARLADFDLDDSSPAVSPHALAAGAAEAITKLAAGLPNLADVTEVLDDDRSDLTAREEQQKDQTETVIRTAHAAGKAAVWVMGQGIAAAAKGKWFRRTHSSLEQYVVDLIPDVVPRQARRWVTGYPIALAITSRTGESPVEGQVREIADLPESVAVELYAAADTAARAAGGRLTAKHLTDLRRSLRDRPLPADPDQAREDLHGRATVLFQPPKVPGPIGPGSFESDSNGVGGRSDADDIEDAEIVEHPQLDSLHRGLIELKAARRHLTKAAFQEATTEGDPERYEELLREINAVLTVLNGRAKRAPQPDAPQG